MLPLMSMASTRSSGESSLTRAAIGCATPSSKTSKSWRLQPADELPAVGDDDGHEHGIDPGLLHVPELLRAHVVDEPVAVGERRHHANVMAAHDRTRIPGAAIRHSLDGAQEPAVDGEA